MSIERNDAFLLWYNSKHNMNGKFHLAFATTDGKPPSLLDRWGGPETAGAQLVRDAISRAVAGDTNRLGALLSVLAIRYVVFTDHLVPAPYAGDVRPVPEQLDFDARFPTVKSPNPENAEALSRALRACEAEPDERSLAAVLAQVEAAAGSCV